MLSSIAERHNHNIQLRPAITKDSVAVIFLAAVWLLAEILVDPVGEFPLNDDWSYTLSLQNWYHNHQYHLVGWTSMPLATQLAWGLIFCKTFGFSFTVLRFSTLVLGLAGGIGAYFLTRAFTENKGISLLAALIFLFNPIYFNLSNTFMTDVPFTSLLILSLLFFVKGLRQDKLVFFVQAFIFVLLATFIRQLGILVACAFSIALVLKERFSLRSLVISAVSIGIPLGLYLFYNHWLKTHNDYPVKYDEGIHRIRYNLFDKDHSTIEYLLRQALNTFLYTGAFIFPFIFRLNWQTVWQRRKTPAFIASVTVMAVVAVFCIINRHNIQVMGNVMNRFGLGTVELRDGTILQTGNLHALPDMLWHLFCIAGIIGGGLMLWTLLQCLRYLVKLEPAVLFMLTFFGAYCFFMLVGGTYDRYIIPMIPVGIVLLLKTIPPSSSPLFRSATIFFLFTGAWFSIAGTFNYFSWNRARWDALHYLMDEKGIPPANIDGGFAFNGYYGYTEADISNLKDHPGPNKKSWWWVQDDQYLLSFGPVKGYTVLKTYPCASPLFPASMSSVYVLQRMN